MGREISNDFLFSCLDPEVLSLTRGYFKEREDCDLQIVECLKFLYLMSSKHYTLSRLEFSI